ncbi:LmbU family transcriptional regulator [Micromonospora sp. DT4]|uniref:LmbU family transcriptional regulator n=1 Tax=Micromonospora sp. DT4 TaxID=3393438 RepID=UPI003CE842B3
MTRLRHNAAAVSQTISLNNRTMHSSKTRQIMVTRVGLNIPASILYDEWENAGKRLSAVADSSAWCLGDWLIFGQHRYTDRYRRAIESVGLDYQTLRNYAWVARSFDLSRRRDNLSFQHHAEVAALPPHEQDYWLDQAATNGWSRNQLRQQVRGSRDSGKPGRTDEALPQLSVAEEQVSRWRAAARSRGCSLESWIVKQLDAAALEVLGRPLSA